MKGERVKMNSPIEVLRGNILHAYENANGQSITMLNSAVHKGLVSSQINYDNGTDKTRTPFVDLDTKEIYLQETYLSHLWSFIYSIFIIYEKSVQTKLIDDQFDGKIHFDSDLTQRAKRLFDWSLSLAHEYSEWDTALPNPKIQFNDDDKILAPKVNFLFQTAVAYLMYHELGHLILGHEAFHREKTETEVSLSEQIQMENDADNFAYGMIISDNDDESTRLQKCLAIMLSKCSSLFLIKEAANLKQTSHPDLDTRIHSLISRQNFEAPQNSFYIWYLGCMAFSFFLHKHDIPMEPSVTETVEESFNNYLEIFDKLK